MARHTAQALVVALLLLTGAAALMGSETVAETEELECQVCHSDVDQSPGNLTDQGLYYRYLETLDGFEQVLERFERCTYCHVEQAGATTMTGDGYRFRWMMQDMAGLQAWLEENHPNPEADSAGDPE